MPVIRKGLWAQILTGPFHSPNKGLSSHASHVTILGIGPGRTLPTFAQVSEPSDDAPGVYLLFEHGRYVARPADAPCRPNATARDCSADRRGSTR